MKNKNTNGDNAPFQVVQTEDVASTGIQKVFSDQNGNKGGVPFITGDGNIKVKYAADEEFRTIPVVAINDYLPIVLIEFDADESDAIIDHFGR